MADSEADILQDAAQGPAKPQGPIWIDLAPNLFETASMSQVIAIANLAMNRLTMRDWGEIFAEVGLRPEIGFEPLKA